MISRTSSSFQNNQQEFQMYHAMDDMLYLSTSSGASGSVAESSSSPHNMLVYNFSVLREKVQQLESFVSAAISPSRIQQESFGVNASGAGNIVQEIIVAASSVMCNLQQLGMNDGATAPQSNGLPPHTMSITFEGSSEAMDHSTQSNLQSGRRDFFSTGNTAFRSNLTNTTITEHVVTSATAGENNCATKDPVAMAKLPRVDAGHRRPAQEYLSSNDSDIIEIDAADLLAKYTHYCQVCGKGFRRDANLRMHMRAHGDEYKTAAALSNPMKSSGSGSGSVGCSSSGEGEAGVVRKYSCPHEGCRWNKKHANFQPLKSMVCVKNHYKRSHCPKMYVCKRCNVKQFSVLSDLRTHEKHCGDLRWRCSCGTNFSRKDKLMGHVALFVGHTPALDGLP